MVDGMELSNRVAPRLSDDEWNCFSYGEQEEFVLGFLEVCDITHMRVALDGIPYTFEEFMEYYSALGMHFWSKAMVAPEFWTKALEASYDDTPEGGSSSHYDSSDGTTPDDAARDHWCQPLSVELRSIVPEFRLYPELEIPTTVDDGAFTDEE